MDYDWLVPSGQQVAALLVAALLVFWMLGAYNRLVALRGAIGRAWQQVDDLLQRRAAALLPLVAELRGPMAAEQGALEAWLAAQAAVRAAADQLRARPVAAPHALELATAEAGLAAAGSRVRALVDQHSGLRAEAAVAPHLAELAEVEKRMPFARQLYNEAAAAYNEALHEFPTRLLAVVYGFAPAERL